MSTDLDNRLKKADENYGRWCMKEMAKRLGEKCKKDQDEFLSKSWKSQSLRQEESIRISNCYDNLMFLYDEIGKVSCDRK